MGADCPEFLLPRLRLFLSADIIGSTALKQSRLGALGSSHAPPDASWFSTIQGFYFEAQQHFKTEWAAQRALFDSTEYFGDEPTLWKTIGDEVLFTKLITDHRQVATTLQCWVRTLASIRQFLTRDSSRLGVKSTAWLAGFPFRNKEVVLHGGAFSSDQIIEDYYKENGRILNQYYKGGATSDVILDYIGPSIDTGFRLTGKASSRKLVLSLDVAYILSLTSPVKGSPIEPITMHYEGQVDLKGVLGGTAYPLFWIDLGASDSAAAKEDALTGRDACDRDDAKAFCDAFFAENHDLIFPPFIQSGSETVLTERPHWYTGRHQNLIKNFRESENPPPEPKEEPSSVNAEEFTQALRRLKVALERTAKRRSEDGL